MEERYEIVCPCFQSPKMMVMCFLMMISMFGLFYFFIFKNLSFKVEILKKINS